MVLAPFLSFLLYSFPLFSTAMASEQAVAASVVRSVWLEQPKYEAAERHYYEIQADRHSGLKIEVGSVWFGWQYIICCFFFSFRVKL